jgi:hypothetical protein
VLARAATGASVAAAVSARVAVAAMVAACVSAAAAVSALVPLNAPPPPDAALNAAITESDAVTSGFHPVAVCVPVVLAM